MNLRVPVRLRVPVVALLAALPLAACVTAPTVTPVASPSAAPSVAASPAPPAPAGCTDANRMQSYAPAATSAYADTIRKRGYLLVGVSADTRLLGAVDPHTQSFAGFDIAMAQAVARQIFGSATSANLRLKVISTAQRISQLQTPVNPADNAAGGVDLIARAFTMTCPRWAQVAYSAEYLRAHQGLLVATGSPIRSVADLGGKTVCAPKGSTSLDTIKTKVPSVKTAEVAAHTDCLVLLQQRQVDAITGDDTILAGFRDQDPTTTVLGDELSQEPYGLGVPLAHKDFAAFVNTALEAARKDGSWQRAYDTYFRTALGAGTAPVPMYGRS